MATIPPAIPPETWDGDSFLKTGGTESNNIYNDFFQETSDGNISIGAKAQRSTLEIATSTFGYIIPVLAIVVALGSAHVFLRTQENGSFAENYTFLCPYLNYGVSLTKEEKNCKTIKMIGDEYGKKSIEHQKEVVDYLTEYIPIKVSKNIMDASPERKFIIDTFSNKVFVNKIMEKFEVEKKRSEYSGVPNIECLGITITEKNLLSTQCSIYGSELGNTDSNGWLGSSRIEALRFVEKIGTTVESQFVLLNPPTSLSQEKVTPALGTNPIFKTRTTLQIQLKYVSYDSKL